MKRGLDYDYMKKHLLDYAVMQIHQGYDPEDIRVALSSYGYNKGLISDIYEAIKDLRPKKRAHVSKAQITKDLYYYIQNLLVDFISKEVEQGYDLEVIRKALINYGHHSDMVDTAIQAYDTGEVMEYETPLMVRFPQQFLFALSLILMLIGIVALSISTNTIILKVLLAFFPAILGIILANVAKMSIRMKEADKFIPIFTMLIVIAVFYLMISFSATMQEINQSEYVIVLNVISAFVFSSIICVFSKDDRDEIIALKEDTMIEEEGREQKPEPEKKKQVRAKQKDLEEDEDEAEQEKSEEKVEAVSEKRMFPQKKNMPFPEETADMP
jgi:hypothetical protein